MKGQPKKSYPGEGVLLLYIQISSRHSLFIRIRFALVVVGLGGRGGVGEKFIRFGINFVSLAGKEGKREAATPELYSFFSSSLLS